MYNFNLNYNANGNIRQSLYSGNYSDNFASTGSYEYTYMYDNSNRFLKADNLASSSFEIINGYDKDGNFVGMKRYGSSNNLADDFGYSYFSGTNKLQTIGEGLTAYNYTYDKNGNMTSDQLSRTGSIKYDHRNLMTEIRAIKTEANPDPFGTPTIDVLYLTNYRYDEAGNRVRKVRYKYTGSDPDPVFVTEGSNPSWSLQSDEFYVRDISGKEIAIYSGSSLTQWNIWGLDNVGKINSDTTRNYYLKDHLGSIRVVLNSTNTVISAQDYDAWGYPLENRVYNASSMRYDFTGKERDDETSYDYFGARYYDSRIGRWTTTEPLINKYPGFSPFCYTLNNPVILTDPTGMWIPNFDPNTNKITVIAEEGDNLQDLYSQLGISADDFAKTYDINNVNEFSVVANETSFDITNFVTPNINYSSGITGNANCMSFVLNATGLELPQEENVPGIGIVPAEESLVIDENFGKTLTEKYQFQQTDFSKTGDVSVFTGNFGNNPKASIHAGIFVIQSRKKEMYYLSRVGPGMPVSLNTESEYREIYRTYSTEVNEINNYRK